MTDLTQIRARAVAVLAPLARVGADTRRRLVGGFRPDAAALARVVAPDLAAAAYAAYAPFWRARPTFGPTAPGDRLHVHAARAADFGSGHRLADHFPPGWREIAPALAPRTVWIAWSYVGGDGRGTLFDGLVLAGERFIWLPQPYLFLSDALRSRPMAAVAHWAE